MCLCTLATDCQIRRPAAGSGDPAGARCDFCPYFLRRYPTSYEPISRPQSDQGLWIGEVMGKLGYDRSTSYFTQVRDYVNDLRATYQADWAFAIFVVDSSNTMKNIAQ